MFLACLISKGRLFQRTGAATINNRSPIVFFVLNRGLSSNMPLSELQHYYKYYLLIITIIIMYMVIY